MMDFYAFFKIIFLLSSGIAFIIFILYLIYKAQCNNRKKQCHSDTIIAFGPNVPEELKREIESDKRRRKRFILTGKWFWYLLIFT